MTWAEDDFIESIVNASRVTDYSSSWTNTNTEGNVTWTWTVTVDGGALNQNVSSNGYAQIGTKKSPSSSITLSTSSFSEGTISKIELDCASADGIGSVTCTVGGKSLGTQNQNIPTWSNNNGGIVTFQGSASGKIELTMSNDGNKKAGAMYVKSITVTYINKANPDLTYSEESVTINKGEEFTAPELYKTESFNETIAYESSNTAVATISNTGEVTLGHVAGIATIIASFSGNSSWAASSASYTLTVNDPDNPMTTINFGFNNVAINETSITGNDSENNNWTITTVGTSSFTNAKTDNFSQVGSNNKPATSITFTTTLSTSIYPTYDITAFSANFGGFSETAGKVTLKVGETVVGEGNLNGDKDVVITSTSSATGNTLTVTITGIKAAVKCYSISYLAMPFVEMNQYGLMSYAFDKNLDFTGSGLKAYAVTGINGNELTMTEVTAAKAGEGLMLEGKPGNHTVLKASTEPAAVSGNMLVGLTAATEVQQVQDVYTTFILANGADGVNWYMLAEDRYTLKANSAYLKLTADQIPASRSLTMVFGDPSGIENVNRQAVNNNQYFDLSGRRVAQPTKGLYIVNGKKVYIK